jgi:hypothetical protein
MFIDSQLPFPLVDLWTHLPLALIDFEQQVPIAQSLQLADFGLLNDSPCSLGIITLFYSRGSDS